MIRSQKFHANGKLLISAEYFVLYGADALAIPTSRGQGIEVSGDPGGKKELTWTTKVMGETVYSSVFDHMGKCTEAKTDNFSQTLEQIFRYLLLKKGPGFLESRLPLHVVSEIEFPLDWGLGSSSTLISNLAAWADVDPYDFQRSVFKGSGYDIACAQSTTPIIYRLENQRPIWKEVTFDPTFSEHLFFIHLNKKQSSREAISRIKKLENEVTPKLLMTISDMTAKMCHCKSEKEFALLMTRHEEIVSAFLNIKTVKERLFRDYPGGVKSLGAWGGDFIMVTGTEDEMGYFREKGFNTILSFDEMILAPR